MFRIQIKHGFLPRSDCMDQLHHTWSNLLRETTCGANHVGGTSRIRLRWLFGEHGTTHQHLPRAQQSIGICPWPVINYRDVRWGVVHTACALIEFENAWNGFTILHFWMHATWLELSNACLPWHWDPQQCSPEKKKHNLTILDWCAQIQNQSHRKLILWHAISQSHGACKCTTLCRFKTLYCS